MNDKVQINGINANKENKTGIEKNNSFLLNQNYSNKLNSNPIDIAEGSQSESVVGSMLINPKIDGWLFPVRLALLINDINKNYIMLKRKFERIVGAIYKINNVVNKATSKEYIKQNSYIEKS